MATIKDKFNENTSVVDEAIELLKELKDMEGQYVWRKLTANDKDFVSYVTADNEDSYPNGGIQEEYWYEKVDNTVTNGRLLEDYALNTTIEPNTFVNYSEHSDATYGSPTTIYGTQQSGNHYKIKEVPNTNYAVGLYNDGSYWYLYTVKVEGQAVTKIHALSTGLTKYNPLDFVVLDNGKVITFYEDDDSWTLVVKVYTISSTGTLTLVTTLSQMNYAIRYKFNGALKCVALTNNKFILVGRGYDPDSYESSSYNYIMGVSISEDYTITLGEWSYTYWSSAFDLDKIDGNKVIYTEISFRNSENYPDAYASIITLSDSLVVTIGTFLKLSSNSSANGIGYSTYSNIMDIKVLPSNIAVCSYSLANTNYLQTIKIGSSSLSKVSSTTHNLTYSTIAVFYKNYIILSGYSPYTGKYYYINSIGYRISDSGGISSGGVSIQITDSYYTLVSYIELSIESVYVGNTVLLIHNQTPKEGYVYPIAQCFGLYAKGIIPATSSILGISKTRATTTEKGQYWVLGG